MKLGDLLKLNIVWYKVSEATARSENWATKNGYYWNIAMYYVEKNVVPISDIICQWNFENAFFPT